MEFDQLPYTGLFDPTANVAITLDEDSYKVFESIFEKMPRKINTELFTNLKGIAVYQNNHAYWMVEKVMRFLVPSGIPQHIRNTIFDVSFKYSANPIKVPSGFINVVTSPKVFSLEDLKFGFIIWLGSITVALTAFVLELIYCYGMICFKNFVGLYYFLILFKIPNGNK